MPLSSERIIRLFALSLNVIFNHTLNFTLRMYSKTVSSNSHCIADLQLKMIDSTWETCIDQSYCPFFSTNVVDVHF